MSILTEAEKARLAKVREHLANGTNPYTKDELTKINIGEKREVIRKPFIEHVISENRGMTPQEELFQKFYSHEKILVRDMDMMKLREHREELSQIAFEAKARLVATDDETKERKAKDTKTKEWLTTSVIDQSSSDAINVVKVRKERMSKMDRIESQLLAAGIEEEVVKVMIREMERKATEKNLKTITFDKPSVETSVVQVEVKKEVSKEPFDPSSLTFGE